MQSMQPSINCYQSYDHRFAIKENIVYFLLFLSLFIYTVLKRQKKKKPYFQSEGKISHFREAEKKIILNT